MITTRIYICLQQGAAQRSVQGDNTTATKPKDLYKVI